MKTVYIDIMLNGLFYRQIAYKYCPLFPIDEKEINEFVLKKCPTLKGKNFSVQLTDNRIVK